MWAIAWGYRPIPNATKPDQELPVLDEWAHEQDKTPWLRFSTALTGGSDPGELMEAVGDADAVKSTALGINNLRRVARLLLPATIAQNGSSYNDLSELYGDMIEQWVLELNHVVAIVGGLESQHMKLGRNGVRFWIVPKARQVEAVRFLNENAFVSPTWQIDEEILRRIEPVGTLNRIGIAQKSVLSNLLSSSRFARLVEQEALGGGSVYTAKQLMSEVRGGIWAELNEPVPLIDAYRRNLQRAYLDIADLKIKATTTATPQASASGTNAMLTSGDERGFYLIELRELSDDAGSALAKATDRTTRMHLEAVIYRIQEILDSK